MNAEDIATAIASNDPALGLRASLALHRLAERVEANHVAAARERAGRGSRSPWASPANQIQQGLIMTTEPVVPEIASA